MRKEKKKVIVMGKGKLAVKVANWFLRNPKYRLVYVVPVVPIPEWTSSLKDWGKLKGVVSVDSGHYGDIPNAKEDSWSIDLAVSITYDKIIKEWFINKCKKIINIHNGPLPRYRGVSPINWALKNNEKEHGVTIHEITPGIDDGPIIAQVKFSIYPEFDEVGDVYERCLKSGWSLFKETMPLLDKIKSSPQDHSQAVYYNAKQNILLGERRNFTKKLST